MSPETSGAVLSAPAGAPSPLPPDGAPPPGRDTAVLLSSLLLGLLVAGLGAAVLRLPGGSPRAAALVPVLLSLGVLGAVLAVTRFEAAVLLLLAARSSLDAAKGTGGPEPTEVVVVGFLLVAVLWLAAQRRSGLRTGPLPLTCAALALLLTGLLSAVVSPSPTTSLLEWSRLSSVLVMFVVLEQLLRRRELWRWALVAVYASSVGPIAVALVQRATGTAQVIEGLPRVSGTFIHPNSLALYLTFLLVMGLALVTRVRGAAQAALTVFLLAGCGVLVLTYTRGAWIAAAAGALLVAWLLSRRLALLLVAAGGVLLVSVPSVLNRFADLAEGSRPSGATGNSLVWRVQQWQDAMVLADDRPVTGAGLAMVQELSTSGKLPHSDYVRAYVESGTLGLVAYLALLLVLVVVAHLAWVRASDPLERGIAAGYAGCVLALLLMSLADNLISQSVVLWYLAVFAGLGSAIAHRARGPVAGEVAGA